MNEENFNRQLNVLNEELKKVNKDSEPSYAYLLDKLSDLSIDTINSRKGAILHFLADSYNGSSQIASRVADFITLYTTR